MSALDQKISAIQAFFEQYPFLKNEFPMLIDGLKSVKTKAEGGDDSTNEAATGAPDTLPTYTGLGIIKIDKCPATYEVKGKDKPIKLNKGDQIKIKNVSGSEIEADYYSQKKGHITIKVDKVNVILTKDNLQDIQNLPKTDIVVTHKDLDTRIDWIDHTNFIAGWQITPSSPNLYINLSKVDTCFHRGLAHIADKLHILQLGNGQTFIGDKPLDVNSLVVGSIDFNQTKVSDWKAKYQWTDDDCNNFAGKEIAFRFTCFMQEKKKVILVEKIGEVQRTNLSKTELANLKNQTYKNTTFDVNKLKGTHNYVKLNSNQEKDVLESLSKIPQEFQSYLEGVNIVFDTNPPQGEQAHIGEQQGERVFSFSAK